MLCAGPIISSVRRPLRRDHHELEAWSDHLFEVLDVARGDRVAHDADAAAFGTGETLHDDEANDRHAEQNKDDEPSTTVHQTLSGSGATMGTNRSVVARGAVGGAFGVEFETGLEKLFGV